MSDSSESIKISVLREKNENGIDFESEDDEKHINRDIKIKKEDENAPMESSWFNRKDMWSMIDEIRISSPLSVDW